LFCRGIDAHPNKDPNNLREQLRFWTNGSGH
jgi:hypothetical protein